MLSSLQLGTVSPAINRLALGSFLALLVKILFLNDIPEPIHGLLAIGNVIESILASVVAGYAFYLFSVHLGEVRARQALAPFIIQWVSNITGSCHEQITQISTVSGVPLSLAELSVDDVRAALRTIDPRSDSRASTLSGLPITWMQFFDLHRRRSKESSAKLYAQLAHCDPSFIGLVNAIEESRFFHMLETLPRDATSYPSPEYLTTAFTQYCIACRNLRDSVSEGRFRARAA